MRVGIDIGGTHTDAVALDGNTIVAKTKTLTTSDIVTGFSNALEQLDIVPTVVVVGTTHATNAVLQRKGLSRVGVIRLAGHRPDTLPACGDWPEELREAVLVDTITVDGGYNCDGTEITLLDEAQVKAAAHALKAKGAETIAVVGVFAPLNPSQELQVRELIDMPVTLSHEVGGMGIVERENGAILNSALMQVMETGFKELGSKVDCPMWVTQNNGSIVDLETAVKFPILTLSAGPTNSFVGGAKLAGLKDAIVIDVGGTSTDVGIVRKGYPRRCLQQSSIGGVALGGALPDVQAIALGGGSYVSDGAIGPKSCGSKLMEESLAFGGNRLTMTDISLALGIAHIPDAADFSVSKTLCTEVMNKAKSMIQHLVKRIAIGEEGLPVVMIGGGAALFEDFDKPEYAGVANAYGAAMAEISASVDKVVCLKDRDRQLKLLKQEAIDAVIRRGGNPDRVAVVDVSVIPYHYVPGEMARVIIVASASHKWS